jgi:hypothetical protein
MAIGIERRQFLIALGSLAGWPLTAGAQQATITGAAKTPYKWR